MRLFSSASFSENLTKKFVDARCLPTRNVAALLSGQRSSDNEVAGANGLDSMAPSGATFEAISISGNKDEFGVRTNKDAAKATQHQIKDSSPPLKNE